MTPAEKAKQLVQRFYFSLPNNGGFTGPYNINDRWEEGKKCASIAVDEIINWHLEFLFISKESVGHQYWLEVKQEIEKL